MSRGTALRGAAGPALVAGVAIASAILTARFAKRRRAIDFRDRVVAITGGSRGLGLLLARELARQGARIALLARDPRELDAARYELMACHDAEVITVPCDVRDRDDAAWAISRVVAQMGGLDVLINNAGVIQVGPVDHMVLEDFEEAMAVHLWGPLYLTLAALPHLRARKGARIVNIASIGGKIAVPHLLPYSVSKFARRPVERSVGRARPPGDPRDDRLPRPHAHRIARQRPVQREAPARAGLVRDRRRDSAVVDGRPGARRRGTSRNPAGGTARSGCRRS